MKLRTKFLLWTNSLIAFIVLGIGAMTLFSESRLLTTEMNQHQASTVQRLAKVCEESLYQSDVVLFNYFETLKSERGFLSAAFMDVNGKIQAHSQQKSAKGSVASATDPFAQIPLLTPSPRTKVLSAPVVFAGSPVGTARLALSEDVLQNYIRLSLLNTLKRIGIILSVALLIGFLGALLLTKTMVEPIQEIVVGMKNISEGRLVPMDLRRRRDELGWLGNEINATIAKLRELDEMKRNFFSRVTHDLRSPLIGIQGLVSLLLKGKLGAVSMQSQEALVDVGNFTTRLTTLIDDLLTSTKLESGREEVDITEFDIRETIEEVSKFYLPLAKERNVSLILDLPKEKAVVQADQDKMIHVLTNLVSNAYKFTKHGSVRIGVRNINNRVQVTVADTGVGIPQTERKKIFDRFYRVESTKKVKGTGLGLFIVKSLLELQKATIAVDENIGGGAKFTLSLPSRNGSPPLSNS